MSMLVAAVLRVAVRDIARNAIPVNSISYSMTCLYCGFPLKRVDQSDTGFLGVFVASTRHGH